MAAAAGWLGEGQAPHTLDAPPPPGDGGSGDGPRSWPASRIVRRARAPPPVGRPAAGARRPARPRRRRPAPGPAPPPARHGLGAPGRGHHRLALFVLAGVVL